MTDEEQYLQLIASYAYPRRKRHRISLGILPTNRSNSLRTIYSAGSDLLELINDVLDLSKVEAGKVLLNIEEISVHRMADYIEKNFTHVTEEKGLYLTINISDDIPESIQTDRQRVEQILKNFISNAIKFTSSGGVTISIGRPKEGRTFAKSEFDPRSTIVFAVADTGTGIPKEKQRLIFEAFQQADGTTSRRFGGTGLGLSISKELASLLGGRNWLGERGRPGECVYAISAPNGGNGKNLSKQSTPRVAAAQWLDSYGATER